MKKTDTLKARFAVIFLLFGIVLTIFCSLAAFRNESAAYNDLKLQEIRKINNYLNSLIIHDGEDFLKFYRYLEQYGSKLEIPLEFDEYESSLEAFNLAYAKAFPGTLFGVDMTIDDLPEELLLLYLTYDYEYWTIVFEDARDKFGLEYAYLIEPDSHTGTVTYVVDPLREPDEENPENLLVCSVDPPEENPKDEVQVLWRTWDEGMQLDEFQSWDNEYGYNYTCYTPLFVGGEKLGLICTEVAIDSINIQILNNSLLLAGNIAGILIISLIVIMWYMDRRFLTKISMLTENVREYSDTKAVSVADKVMSLAGDKTEIGVLAKQMSDMIVELDNHMKTLVSTSKELDETKQREADAKKLAMRDSLTGIRNKAAYDVMVKDLDHKIDNGFTEFCMGMVDLNYLKRINDTYGHDKGNITIVRLCSIVCNVFKHSPVFRIGGDEFVIVLMGDDYDNATSLERSLLKVLESLQNNESLPDWERVSAAVGIARFDPEHDRTAENVFKRADEIMYGNKQKMKAVRE
ncbi:MAG: GGDEF domain-containing protein [Lachnospiraceae bacterium]|nr:GGDEF domain-containing protein [Lachnospiraceae bacterium]